MDSFIGLKLIKENKNQDEILTVCNVLIQIMDNILANPNDLSYRSIKLDSDEVSTKLMPYSGGLESLFEIGFEEADDTLILSETVNSDQIKKLRDELHYIKKSSDIALTSIKKNLPSSDNNPPSTPVATVNSRPISVATADTDSTPVAQQCKSTLENFKNPAAPAAQRVKKRNLAVKQRNQKFGQRLQGTFDHVLLYEYPSLKQKALQCMPVERFNSVALSKYTAYKSQIKSDEKSPYNLRDFIVLELMAWFKNEFFKWVNQPDCDHCNTNEAMKFKYGAVPSSSENIWMAGNVEVYECSRCVKSTRFPRYNHPEKLLETRRGRCGEWANCFTLLLRSLDFDARYILDWTDHVWSEVFSESQQRWLHIDPCENIMDKPLIYEHGWGKKLSYVIGFSFYQCIDVTWRYTTEFKEAMTRRKECSENWLVKFTSKISAKRQSQFERSRRHQIEMRTVTEIVEFLTAKKVKDGEDVGRQSGSLQWRLDRGEIQIPEISTGFEFKVTPETEKLFRVEYNSVSDKYVTSNNSQINGWKNGVSKSQNIQIKTENDWKMVYLARTCGSESAFIEWSFDLSSFRTAEAKFLIKKVDLKLQSKCFETGRVTWSVSWSNTDDKRIVLDNSEASTSEIPFVFSTNSSGNWELNKIVNQDLSVLKIRADLNGGNGQNAWQHTQLFRQNLNDNKNLFEVCFHFE